MACGWKRRLKVAAPNLAFTLQCEKNCASLTESWEQMPVLSSICGPPYCKMKALHSSRVWVTLTPQSSAFFFFIWTSKAFLAANLMYRSRNCSWRVNALAPNQSWNLTSGRHPQVSFLFLFCCAVALNTLAGGFCPRTILEESCGSLLLSSKGLKRKKQFALFSDKTNTFYFCSLKVVQKGSWSVLSELPWCVLSLSDSTFRSLEKLLKASSYVWFFPFEKEFHFLKCQQVFREQPFHKENQPLLDLIYLWDVPSFVTDEAKK